jgi:hypothetical protein
MAKILYADEDHKVRAQFCLEAYFRGHEIHNHSDAHSAFEDYLIEREKRDFNLAVIQFHMKGGKDLIEKLIQRDFEGDIAIKAGNPEKLRAYARQHKIFHVSDNPSECLDAYEKKEGIKDNS